MSIEVADQPDRHRFEAVVDGVVGGGAYYEIDGDTITFTHTEVDDEFEGQGVGSALVQGALDDVRERGLRVVVRCPFIREWIERHPDYQDLTAPG